MIGQITSKKMISISILLFILIFSLLISYIFSCELIEGMDGSYELSPEYAFAPAPAPSPSSYMDDRDIYIESYSNNDSTDNNLNILPIIEDADEKFKPTIDKNIQPYIEQQIDMSNLKQLPLPNKYDSIGVFSHIFGLSTPNERFEIPRFW